MSQNKITLAIVLIALVAITYIIADSNRTKNYVQGPDPFVKTGADTNQSTTTGKLNGNPTTFSHSGSISFKEDDTDVHGTPYFSYTESEGGKATTTLVFDPMSYCGGANGFIECIAMSSTYTMAFNAKRAVVEGIRLNDGAEVLVRKMYILGPDEQPRVPGIGQTFISWQQAKSFIDSCSVKGVMQTHALDVYLTMKDGTQLRAMEPMIDDIFKIVNDTKGKCGNMGLGTE